MKDKLTSLIALIGFLYYVKDAYFAFIASAKALYLLLGIMTIPALISVAQVLGLFLLLIGFLIVAFLYIRENLLK